MLSISVNFVEPAERVNNAGEVGVAYSCSAPEFVIVDVSEFFFVGHRYSVPQKLNEIQSRLKTIFERHVDAAGQKTTTEARMTEGELLQS